MAVYDELKAILGMRDALVRAMPYLGERGLKDDEVWGAFTQCLAAVHRFGSRSDTRRAVGR